MDDADHLRQELRAARNELARQRIERRSYTPDILSRLPYVPEREDEHLHLTMLRPAELEAHIERLKQDLDDVEEGILPTNPDVDSTK